MSSSQGKGSERKAAVDVALVHGPTDDGEGARILRYRDGELSAGEVRPVKEGQTINDSELVKLKPVEASSPVCRVEVVHDPTGGGAEASAKRSGPARVTNEKYRRNWQQVFVRGKRASTKSGRDWSLN